MYNMNNILDLCSKPSKTVRNFNNYVQTNWILTKDKKSVDTLKHFWEISIFLSVYSGHIYISSQTSVWKLTPRSLNFQIKQLLESKEFELALKLAVSLNNKYVLQICVMNKDPKTYRSLNNIGIRVKKKLHYPPKNKNGKKTG